MQNKVVDFVALSLVNKVTLGTRNSFSKKEKV